jgi:hypothetical protein
MTWVKVPGPQEVGPNPDPKIWIKGGPVPFLTSGGSSNGLSFGSLSSIFLLCAAMSPLPEVSVLLTGVFLVSRPQFFPELRQHNRLSLI